jgi:chromatin remodeling complex protein RSC6
MVRKTTSDKLASSASVPAVSAPAASATANASANASANAPKTPRARKAKVEAAPAAEVASPVASATEAAAPVAEVSDSVSRMAEFSSKIQQLNGVVSSLKVEFKNLERAILREMKNAQKSSSKKRRASGNRQPSGFVKPTRISDELAQFLGKEIGTEMARTAVSKEINQYIRSNSLQDKSNGRKINPDAKLSTLLKINKGEELTYFNLQRYMKHHFVKSAVATA